MTKTITLAGENRRTDGYAAPGYGELFSSVKRTWRPGDIRSPKWMKRDNGFDFIHIDQPATLEHLKLYLSGEDDRLMVRNYNAFLTTLDKAGFPMIVCLDVNDAGDSNKVAIIVIRDQTEATALKAAELVDEFSDGGGA